MLKLIKILILINKQQYILSKFTLFVELESLLKYNWAFPFVVTENKYSELTAGARYPVSQIVTFVVFVNW